MYLNIDVLRGVTGSGRSVFTPIPTARRERSQGGLLEPGVGRHEHDHPAHVDEARQALQQRHRVWQPTQQVAAEYLQNSATAIGRGAIGHYFEDSFFICKKNLLKLVAVTKKIMLRSISFSSLEWYTCSSLQMPKRCSFEHSDTHRRRHRIEGAEARWQRAGVSVPERNAGAVNVCRHGRRRGRVDCPLLEHLEALGPGGLELLGRRDESVGVVEAEDGLEAARELEGRA